MNQILLTLILLAVIGINANSTLVEKTTTENNLTSNDFVMEILRPDTLQMKPEIEQEATFYISQGWTGGMGEAVVEVNNLMSDTLKSTSQLKIKMLEDLPIYVDDSHPAIEEVKSKNKCNVLKIIANVTLHKTSDINTSIPPDRDGKPRRKTYYQLVLNDVKSVEPAGICK